MKKILDIETQLDWNKKVDTVARIIRSYVSGVSDPKYVDHIFSSDGTDAVNIDTIAEAIVGALDD